MPSKVLEALVNAGAIGAVLAWALWEMSRDKERLFKVVENNTRALEMIKQSSCVEYCREASR